MGKPRVTRSGTVTRETNPPESARNTMGNAAIRFRVAFPVKG